MNEANVWIALAGLAVVILVQVVIMAFFMGRLFEKVRTNAEWIGRLEKENNDGHGAQGALAVEVGGLKIQVGHLVDTIGELKTDLKERFALTQVTPRPRAAG